MTYLAITSICFAVMLWNYGVRHLGATVGSMYSNLQPGFRGLHRHGTWASIRPRCSLSAAS